MNAIVAVMMGLGACGAVNNWIGHSGSAEPLVAVGEETTYQDSPSLWLSPATSFQTNRSTITFGDTECDGETTSTWASGEATVIANVEAYSISVSLFHDVNTAHENCEDVEASSGCVYWGTLGLSDSALIRITTVAPATASNPAIDESIEVVFDAGTHELEFSHYFLAIENQTAYRTFQILSPAPGDVNRDGALSPSDIGPFIAVLVAGEYNEWADVNCDGAVSVSDIAGFVELLTAE